MKYYLRKYKGKPTVIIQVVNENQRFIIKSLNNYYNSLVTEMPSTGCFRPFKDVTFEELTREQMMEYL